MSSSTKFTKYLNMKAVKLGLPLNGTFELSPCCNFNCEMCYVRKSREEVEKCGGEISAEKWLGLAEVCKKKGMLNLLLTGGEPFLYKEFEKLYLVLIQMGFIISINSNGSLINDKWIDILRKNPPNRINVTLYGGSDEMYEKLCHVKDGFTNATRAVKKLKEAGIPIKLNCSLTPYNERDRYEIIKFAESNDIYVQLATYMFPPVRKNENFIGENNCRLSPELAGKYEIDIKKSIMTESQFKAMAIDFKKGIDEYKIHGDECGGQNVEELPCCAGRSSFWINWKGNMTPCGLMNEPTCNVFDKGFDYSWEFIKKETNKIFMPSKCTDCKMRFACSVCGAVVKAETGGLTKSPEYMCRLTKEKLRYTEEIYNRIMREEMKENEDKEGVH